VKRSAEKALGLGKKANRTAKKANKTASTALKAARKALAEGSRQGPQGPAGPAGKDLVLNTPLASGTTERGVWSVAGGANDDMSDVIEFEAPLSASLNTAHTIRVVGAPPDAGGHCPATGSAERGYFCLYERASTATFGSLGDPTTGTLGASPLGVDVEYTGSGANEAANGSWAVTAP
jgi:hypothetical protein